MIPNFSGKCWHCHLRMSTHLHPNTNPERSLLYPDSNFASPSSKKLDLRIHLPGNFNISFEPTAESTGPSELLVGLYELPTAISKSTQK